MTVALMLDGMDAKKQIQWLTALAEQLHDETILLSENIDDMIAGEVDIAIVATSATKALDRFPNLVWVQSLWAGVDGLTREDLNPAVQLVRLVDPILSQTMAESVLAWTLFLQRDMPFYIKQQTNKQWQPRPNKNAKDIRVSVLGAGELGLAAVNILKSLEFSLSCWSRSPKELRGVNHFDGFDGLDGLKTMLRQTDILICLLPLTNDTLHLLNEDLLSLLPKEASIINFARGAIMDINALLKLLNLGHLAHAVLDVFDIEPLPKNSKLWHHPNITVLPHISAPTNMQSAAKVVAKNIQLYRDKKLIPSHVDITRGY